MIEYTSDPRRLALADELAILNAELIKLGLSDQARILRLRLFAESSLKGALVEAKLKGVSPSKSGERWLAKINIDGQQIYLGTFDTPREAHEAFRSAHLEHHGVNSEYHPDYKSPEPCIDEDDLPCGVSLTSDRKYLARIFCKDDKGNKVTKRLGLFNSADEAHEAFKRAHVEQHRERSRYFAAAQETTAVDCVAGGDRKSESELREERTPPRRFSLT